MAAAARDCAGAGKTSVVASGLRYDAPATTTPNGELDDVGARRRKPASTAPSDEAAGDAGLNAASTTDGGL